jgi:membrane-associated phospholipid phosphatase
MFAVEKHRRFLNLTDKVILLYLGTIIIHAIISMNRLPSTSWYDGWRLHVGVNLLIAVGILLLAGLTHKRNSTWLRFTHTFYPVFLLIWLYPETGLLRHTVIPNDLDAVVLRWNRALFLGDWYQTIPTRLNLFWLEVFHGAYFLYYISLGLFAMLAYRRQVPLVYEYLFVLITAMLLQNWVVILFPAAGPVPLRPEVIPQGVVFIPVMNWIYRNLDNGGGAFPSLHSSAALIVVWYGTRFFPTRKLPLFLFLGLVLISTVVGSFHYPIDTVSGMVTGTLALLFLPRLYHTLHSHESW